MQGDVGAGSGVSTSWSALQSCEGHQILCSSLPVSHDHLRYAQIRDSESGSCSVTVLTGLQLK